MIDVICLNFTSTATQPDTSGPAPIETIGLRLSLASQEHQTFSPLVVWANVGGSVVFAGLNQQKHKIHLFGLSSMPPLYSYHLEYSTMHHTLSLEVSKRIEIYEC